MLKRNLSVVLVLLMILTMLTGCGTDELGYIKLQKEMSELKQAEFTNKTSFELNGAPLGAPNVTVEASLKGEVNTEDSINPYLGFTVDGSYDKFKLEKPVEMRIVDGKVYASTNFFNEANNYYKLMGDDDETFDAQYREIQKYDYWEVVDLTEEAPDTIFVGTAWSNYYRNVVTLIERVFKDLDVELVKKIPNGYAVELDTEEGLELLRTMVDYLDNNRDDISVTILDIFVEAEIEKYVAKYGEDTNAVIDKEEYEKSLIKSAEITYQVVDNMMEKYNSEEMDIYAELFAGSKVIGEITQKDGVYNQNITIQLVIEGEEFGTLKSVTTMKEAKVDRKPIVSALTEEELNKIIGVETPEDSQVYKVSLEWTNNGNETAVEAYRNDGITAIGKSNYVIIENRVYLPLRYIGETLGEEVGWDNDLRQAYVMKDGVRVDMTGVIVNDRTMVKIRDFEKLGYTVEYEQVDGVSRAVILK